MRNCDILYVISATVPARHHQWSFSNHGTSCCGSDSMTQGIYSVQNAFDYNSKWKLSTKNPTINPQDGYTTTQGI